MNCPTCNASVAPGVAFCPECGTRLPLAPAGLRLLQGRYELIRKLGQGGMGSVYLASDRRLSTARWAVKELSDAQITSPLERQQAAEAFKHEAELLARLAHPNLPRVTDHFTEDGKSYLVMEFVPGETLGAYAQRLGLPRPLAEVLGWADQLCEVLEYLHRQTPPVIFRDLKPANVMLTPAGTLKLVDFGIARLFKPGKDRDTQAYGTMGYSAPEQYGRGQTDARSDVFSLGVLLHQLLTGHDPTTTPFRLPPADALNPALPANIAAALARATAPDPDQRFASVAELRQALRSSGNLVARESVQLAVPRPAPLEATPFQPSGGPAKTTGIALTAFWMGVVSVAWMVVAVALVAAGAITGDAEEILSGLGALLALPPLISGPAAAILGVVALFSQATGATTRGRRDAAIGVATGLATLLLCCALLAVFPESELEDARPAPVARLLTMEDHDG
ncbi:MAG: serine/threonine-protein kinase [Chloroflexi bacterium OHK40]